MFVGQQPRHLFPQHGNSDAYRPQSQPGIGKLTPSHSQTLDIDELSLRRSRIAGIGAALHEEIV